MDLYFYNRNIELAAVIDQYWSLIWTERYSEYGDFEVVVSPENMPNDISVNYLVRPPADVSDAIMIVENISIEEDPEQGDMITISGRSYESILTRRIVWAQTYMNGYLQQCVYNFLYENVISPVVPQRKINKFVFEETKDEYINSIAIELQRSYEEIYDVIKDICDAFGIGFRIRWNNNTNETIFSLYNGVDRSYDSTNNPVVFSDVFDNLITSEYSQSIKDYKNIALVAGEGEGADRKITYSGETESSGLDRYELYTDARDLSTNNDNTSEEEYFAQLVNRGNENLSEHGISTAFSGEIDYNMQYKFKVDYNLGDIVQIKTKYGVLEKVRITEYIISDSNSGHSEYPTFILLED